MGPTWAPGTDTRYALPEHTLGWEVLAWTADYLLQPDGPDAGTPWRYTPEQARFILWWYAIDEAGRWLYRGGMFRRVKGWGKDPLAATICAVEFVGPCRFDRWNEDGTPLAKAHPAAWVMTAAVSKEQTRNTMTLFPGMFSKQAIADFKIDMGKELMYAHGGRCRLEAVTSSPRSLEGPRATFVLKNETQHWLANNDGHAMAEVIARNATKSRDGASRVLAISNAHEPGEDSDAEHDYEAWQAIEQGKSRATGFLYDSLEAPATIDLTDEASLRVGLQLARGDSHWLDEDRHVEEIYDPRNSAASSRRFYLNQMVAAEDAWIAPVAYDALKQPRAVVDGEEITLGFDGSKSDDHCALIACALEDGYTWPLGVWDPAEHDGEAPRDIIDGMVRNTHTKYRVCAFFSDLAEWESYVDTWANDLGKKYEIKASARHPISWDMRGHLKETTIEIERLHDEIGEGMFRHDGNPRMRQHFHNARRRPNSWGVTVGKEHRMSKRKIDSVPATMLARMARRLVLANPKRRRPKTGRASF